MKEKRKGDYKVSLAKQYFYKFEEMKYAHLLRLISNLC